MGIEPWVTKVMPPIQPLFDNNLCCPVGLRGRTLPSGLPINYTIQSRYWIRDDAITILRTWA